MNPFLNLKSFTILNSKISNYESPGSALFLLYNVDFISIWNSEFNSIKNKGGTGSVIKAFNVKNTTIIFS